VRVAARLEAAVPKLQRVQNEHLQKRKSPSHSAGAFSVKKSLVTAWRITVTVPYTFWLFEAEPDLIAQREFQDRHLLSRYLLLTGKPSSRSSDCSMRRAMFHRAPKRRHES
jgi:hypothetical protein